MPIIQGRVGKAPPKGDSCILCGDVKMTAEGVGVRRTFSAKMLPEALVEAGSPAPPPVQPVPRHALLIQG